jgi:histidinol phosphatase-like PHP family hydrolase
MTDRVFSLHNHTPFSVGAFSIDEVIEAHLECGGVEFAGVGISDYLFATPTSLEPKSERDFERVFGKEARQYVAMVGDARRRWGDKVHLFCGAEIHWPMNRAMLGVIRNMLEGVDYVLFSHVDWAGLTQLANQVRRWPCAVGLCETPVEKQFPNTSREQVIRTMANARMFYEVNTSFLPLHDRDPWYGLLPSHRVPVALGCDTHDDLRSIEQLAPLYDYVCRRGLKDRLLDPSPRENGRPAAGGSA